MAEEVILSDEEIKRIQAEIGITPLQLETFKKFPIQATPEQMLQQGFQRLNPIVAEDLRRQGMPGEGPDGLDHLRREEDEKARLIGEKKKQLTRQLLDLEQQEASAFGVLKAQVGEREKTIEQQLQERLAGISAETDLAQRGIGQQFASRNLLRSSFAQQAQQDVALQSQAARTEQITGAEIAKTSGRKALADIEKQIGERKKETEFDLNFADLEQLIKERQTIDEGEMKIRFQQQLAKLKLEAMQEQNLTNTFGSLASTGAFLAASFA